MWLPLARSFGVSFQSPPPPAKHSASSAVQESWLAAVVFFCHFAAPSPHQESGCLSVLILFSEPASPTKVAASSAILFFGRHPVFLKLYVLVLLPASWDAVEITHGIF